MLAIVSIILIIQILKINKKYKEAFPNGDSLDEKFSKFTEKTEEIGEKYEKISKALMDVNDNMNKCVQKVGVVRYNPFDEAGGNLCFAVALLDSENNGVVINGIHSRSGCYTYAKPIEMGVSEYVISAEEQQAIDMAIKDSYITEERKKIIEDISKSYKEDVLFYRRKKKKGFSSRRTRDTAAE